MTLQPPTDAESRRLAEDADRKQNWKRWGPYLSERQWGTVREDYSPDGDCWNYFPHDHARSRAYRWGEDGLLGFTDRECRLCFGLALWNGVDPILKERLYGLTGPQGNHGEDVKEEYFYLDSTPTHSYFKALYKYPQKPFPYAQLEKENIGRPKHLGEFELADAGVFEDGRYFDVMAEYAKSSPDDILIRITAANRGPEPAVLHLLPTLWFRNTWAWGSKFEGGTIKPYINVMDDLTLLAEHVTLQRYTFIASTGPRSKKPEFLVTENDTNRRRLYHQPNQELYVKDAFHEYVVNGNRKAVNPDGVGTKAAARYELKISPGDSVVIKCRLFSAQSAVPRQPLGPEFNAVFKQRIAEADEFYSHRIPRELSADQKAVSRQAYAGLLWSKQYYHYDVKTWLEGDPKHPAPPASRRQGRNSEWTHLYNRDVLSMPDKWEYPWFAAWDLAFHMVALARIDGDFAKRQLELLLREWYMHANGQIPAYEFAFGDVNPPVHAWACWRVYKLTGPKGRRDRAFLASVFQKLLVNFTWWVNRKDVTGRHIFSGGFLGLDNIGVFDRSNPPPGSGRLSQADGTAWMGFYCATMLAMALELASEDPGYEDMASKFFEHFVAIADAMNELGGTGLWDEKDGFYYDLLDLGDRQERLRVRSLVGVIPLFTVEVLENESIEKMHGFRKRMDWFLKHRPDLARHISYMQRGIDSDPQHESAEPRYLLAIPSKHRLERVLKYVFDENEFLSPYGVRSLSRIHGEKPFVLKLDGCEHRVAYSPGESETWMFGGNSNWRGPIWFPLNYLLIECLQRYHYFYGDAFQIQVPAGSGRMMNLRQAATELGRRMADLFAPDETGRRPCHGVDPRYHQDPAYRDLLLFHEYFHGETGRGLGASHQTGWTALITRCLDMLARP